MKNILFTSLLAVIFAGSVHAQIKLPRGSFEVKDIEKAAAMAQRKKVPIAFFYAYLDVDCPRIKAGTTGMLEGAGNRPVVVHVTTDSYKTSLKGCTPEAKKALQKGYPLLVVMDPEMKTELCVMPYIEYVKDPKKNMNVIKKAVRSYRAPAVAPKKADA